jgi:hypothetical protein
MTRRFTLVTVALTAFVAFLVGAIFAGGLPRSAIVADARTPPSRPAHLLNAPASASLVNFADVVERLNPAVVNIDATARGRDPRRRRG